MVYWDILCGYAILSYVVLGFGIQRRVVLLFRYVALCSVVLRSAMFQFSGCVGLCYVMFCCGRM